MPDDYSKDTSTTGQVAVGGTATGEIEARGDWDWFAVELVAGRTYVIDLEGRDSQGGTLDSTVLRGLYNSEGTRISSTQTNDGGLGDDARLTFTATVTGTHYIAARGYMNATGTYTVRVTDATPVDGDADRSGAVALGDLTELAGPRFPSYSLDGVGDRVDYFEFTLTEAKNVGLGLRRQDADADLFLEDEQGNVLARSEQEDKANEWISETLLAGKYYVRVEAQEGGTNDYKLRYGVSEADADKVAELEAARNGTAETVTPRVALGQEDTSDPPEVSPSVPESSGEDLSEDNSTAGRVRVGESVTGNIGNSGDRDWFAVDLKAGSGYRFDLEGSDTDGGTLRDPFLRGIYNSNGELIDGTADDDGGEGRNSQVTFTAAEDGTYYLSAAGYGSRQGTYTLSAKEQVDDFAAGTETTGAVTVGGTASGEIGASGDRDWFEVTLEQGKRYRFDLEGTYTDSGTLYDPYLRGIYDSEGKLVDGTTNDDGGSMLNSRLFLTASESGTYYVSAGSDEVTAPSKNDTGTYKLSVTDVTSDVTDDFTDGNDTTGAVTVGGSATGEVEFDGDRDWFEVELGAGQRYQIDLQGSDTEQGTLEDPRIYGVYNSDGNLISNTSNDDGGSGSNSRVSFVASDTGTHYISAASDSEGTGTYTLSISADNSQDDYAEYSGNAGTVTVGGSATGEVDARRDRDWFAVELVTGKRYQIDLEGSDTDKGTLGDPNLYGIYDSEGNEISGVRDDDGGFLYNSRLIFEPEESGTYYISAAGATSSEGTYTLSVKEYADDYAAGTGTTGAVTVGGSATGEIQHVADVDWLGVTLAADTTYRIEVKGRIDADDVGGTLWDPLLRVYDSTGSAIENAWDDDGGVLRNARLDFTPDTAGKYFIAVEGPGSFDVGTYTVEVAETI